ncbi:MAG TPA: hypothetical protein PKY77_23025 [Phycisphaerae bacterium]|nr:hypothetical protein [Phycisphaerae bacterium]HRY66427.1 hypothetical protein [Phycisphaerae bacterium]HSA25865.1 hypothetical protein [Phycisphaerae bacterium]
MRIHTHQASVVAFVSMASLALPLQPSQAHQPRAALSCTGLPGEDPDVVTALGTELRQAGYEVAELDATGLCDPARLNAGKFDLLALANGNTLPDAAAAPIEAFARSGGDIIALKTPLWEQALIPAEGRWMSREDYQRSHAGDLPPHVIFDFTPPSIARWIRTHGPGDGATTAKTTDEGPQAGRRALHVTCSKMENWDTHGQENLTAPFPPGHTLTIFAARGGPNTRELAIEWREKDGSRWIAVVALAQEWRQYVLTPRDFRYWESIPARSTGPFQPENANALFVGLAASHTRSVGSGPHEYWIGPFGTAMASPEYDQLCTTATLPRLETLAPVYKLFDCHAVRTLVVRDDQAIIEPATLTLPAHLRSPHPRPRGGGFDSNRTWRWIPLIEARTTDGQWRGTPATLIGHADGPHKGGLWASFGIADNDWYRHPQAIRRIGQVARWMSRGTLLLDGGTDHFAYFPDQSMRIGVRAFQANTGEPGPVEARVTLSDNDTGRQVWQKSWPIRFDGDRIASAEATWKPAAWPRRGLKVCAELLLGGTVIDRVVSEAQACESRQEKHFVTTKDGHFTLDGKPWRAHGVNYMPSSGIGTEDGAYFENWLGRRSYDPEIAQRDLERIKALGLNSVSVFVYHQAIRDQNLLDLLRRLEDLDLRANLSLRPGSPKNFTPCWPLMKEIIEFNHLRENDTIFAYDLDWEPTFGTREERRIWDRHWEQWIVERYGSIDAAEKDWQVPVPRDAAGTITSPPPEQIDTNGPWRAMTAAYRRFLDTLLYHKYGHARHRVREIDPNHLVSFRMADAACPTYRWNGRITYDFPYLAAAVDFLAPEAYGRIGDWEKVRPGWFQVAYARWAGPNRPVIWAEAGVHVWDLGTMAPSPTLMTFQAQLYRDLYRMFIASGTDGVFFWWYPGGFRCHEASDYGIINPDGSDRPVTPVIREQAGPLLNAPLPKPVDHWIEIDRDRHPDGVSGIYDAAKDEFWKAIETGRTPGLRTKGTTTTSAECPLDAIGNVPHSEHNPPKYLDAAFDSVEVEGADGRWSALENGASIKLRSDVATRLRVTLTNLGEARWISSGQDVRRPGCVVLVIREGDRARRIPLPASVDHQGSTIVDDAIVVPPGGTDPTDLLIGIEAVGRASFGPKHAIRLVR